VASKPRVSVYGCPGLASPGKKEGKMKKIGLILVVFAFLLNCASTGQSPKVGENAPDFSLVDVAGNEVRLNDFKGKKNVVLIFFADDS
jgi:cytochrome oxidase Cu insertion factor (SCO1/SenC/PrrC family)